MQDLDPSDICKKKFLNPLKRIRVIIRTPTHGRTDRRTDGRTNRVNPGYPPKLRFGGYNNLYMLCNQGCNTATVQTSALWRLPGSHQSRRPMNWYSLNMNTEKMSSFWWNFHYWLHWKLSKWQLPVQPVMKISSKWRHFRFSEVATLKGHL